MQEFENPFRPGAGQRPPYLAGRQEEQGEFIKALEQPAVIQNLIITGLRGVGKTVLLESFKPLAIDRGWLWVGTDLSESASLSEHNMSIRIMTDIASLMSGFTVSEVTRAVVGFKGQDEKIPLKADFALLKHIYDITPGLDSDKLKAVLSNVAELVKSSSAKGIILAYDEAQILRDQTSEKQFPLSLLLETIQYLQRQKYPVLLLLTGLPTLFASLVEARTYAERMFHIINLDRLGKEDSREAIAIPIKQAECPVRFTMEAIGDIVAYSGGYPYFIQFICKEAFDSYIQQQKAGIGNPSISLGEIVRKLDTDFYAGRWSRITDRQRDLMKTIAQLPTANEEFTVQNIAEMSRSALEKPFSPSHIIQILAKLEDLGLIYKNRHGKYSFAVPLLPDFINRQS